MLRMVAVMVALLGFALAPQMSSAHSPYAPLDQPGPPLSVPLTQLQASLSCEPSVTNARVEPVLLNPATGVTAEQNYSWNWEPALDKLGIPWCAYTAPYHTLGDIPTSGEYLVYAIRTMDARPTARSRSWATARVGCLCAGRCASGPTRERWSTT